MDEYEREHMGNMTQSQGWHTAQWGTWGWFETILKLIAIGAGILAFAGSDAANALTVGASPAGSNTGTLVVVGNSHLAALVVLALLTLAALAQLGIRFMQRETISLGFAVLNLLGHLGLLVALLRVPDQPALPLIFGVFYLLGQIVKIQFLRVTGYTEGGANTTGMLRVAAIMAAIYALFAILMLV